MRDRSSQVLRQRFRGSLADLIRESHMAAPRGVDVTHDETVPASIAAVLETKVATVVRRTRMMGGGIPAEEGLEASAEAEPVVEVGAEAKSE